MLRLITTYDLQNVKYGYFFYDLQNVKYGNFFSSNAFSPSTSQGSGLGVFIGTSKKCTFRLLVST